MKTTLSPFKGPSGPGEGKKNRWEGRGRREGKVGEKIVKIKEVFGKREIHSIKYKIQTYKGIDA